MQTVLLISQHDLSERSRPVVVQLKRVQDTAALPLVFRRSCATPHHDVPHPHKRYPCTSHRSAPHDHLTLSALSL